MGPPVRALPKIRSPTKASAGRRWLRCHRRASRIAKPPGRCPGGGIGKLLDSGDPQEDLDFARCGAFPRRFARGRVSLALMRAQIASLQRTAALQTYFACRRYLADDLASTLRPETMRLYRSIIEVRGARVGRHLLLKTSQVSRLCSVPCGRPRSVRVWVKRAGGAKYEGKTPAKSCRGAAKSFMRRLMEPS